MEITIKGSTKEIAELVLLTQTRQKDDNSNFDGFVESAIDSLQNAVKAIGGNSEERSR